MDFFPIHKMCRICLKQDLLASVSIFSHTYMMRPIEMIEKLHICKIHPEDNLPTLLCQSCLYRLLDAYNLQQLAEASEQRLREYLNTNDYNNCALSLNVINQESSNFSSTIIHESVKETNDSTAAIYANFCDMFERNVVSNDIEVEENGTDDVLNDVEIDVSSLTRSEADDTLSDVLVEHRVNDAYPKDTYIQSQGQDDEKWMTSENFHRTPMVESVLPARCKRTAKLLKEPDKCEECGKVFKYTGYLEVHKRIHTGEKPFKCMICFRKFTQSSNLLLHQRNAHDKSERRRFQCEKCSSFFTTSSNLKAHALIHLEKRDFQCSHCERSFKSIRELRRHEPIHKPIKDIVCEVCQKAFTKQSYLNAHMAAIHQGIRRHKCTECAKVFSSKSNLICHMRTHTGEKPFQCKCCTWKFNQSSALMRHMKKHLKSKTVVEENVKPQDESMNVNSSLLGTYISNTELSEANTSMPLTSSLTSKSHPQSYNNSYNVLSALTSTTSILTPAISNELVNDMTPDGSSLSSASSVMQAYDFTKNNILDFSLNPHNHTQNMY